MLRPIARSLFAICAAVVLAMGAAAFGQSNANSLVGLTRAQVLEKLGEPASNIKAGAREVLFFPHQKLTLRNNVVVDVEAVSDAPPRRPGELAPAPNANGVQPGAATAAPNSTPATPSIPENSSQSKASPPATGDAPLAIKQIKSGGTPSPKAAARPAPAAPKSVEPAPVASAPPPAPPAATSDTARSAALVTTPATVAPASETNRPVTVVDVATPAVVEEITVTEPAVAKPVVDLKKKVEVQQRWRLRRDAETEDEPVQIFSRQTYIIGFITMAAGAAFLWWRQAQRKLALAATSVSHTPFEHEAVTDTGGQFTPDFVGKLGAKKFERLVASYYTKTGVMAERTNAGSDDPVHIKIFWKGEPKPFAGVQCHANPPSLLGAKPLQDLFTALSAAEIRRGYVVTTGKFNVEARDYAEEKHFTLLPGDILLEKLNALPPMARAELLKEMNTEDAAVPTTGGPVT